MHHTAYTNSINITHTYYTPQRHMSHNICTHYITPSHTCTHTQTCTERHTHKPHTQSTECAVTVLLASHPSKYPRGRKGNKKSEPVGALLSTCFSSKRFAPALCSDLSTLEWARFVCSLGEGARALTFSICCTEDLNSGHRKGTAICSTYVVDCSCVT